jgi:capsular exopolysaccharide synthesis family protein
MYYSAAVPYGGPLYAQPGDASADEDSLFGEISLMRILGVLVRRWIICLGLPVIALLLAGLYLAHAPRVYEAECMLEMRLRSALIMDTRGALNEDAVAQPQSTEEIFNTRLQVFRGQAVLDSALHELEARYPDLAEESSPDRETLAENVDFSLVRKSRLVRVAFQHTNAVFAADVANAFGNAAERVMLEESRSKLTNAVGWLRAQTQTQQETLMAADRALADFRSSNQIQTLELRLKSMEDSILMFNSSLRELENQEIAAQDVCNFVTGVELSPEAAGTLPTSIPRAERIQAALDRWLTAQAERNALLTRFTPRHPEVQTRDAVLQSLRQQVIDALVASRETAAANLKLIQLQSAKVRTKVEALTASVTELEARIAALNMRLQQMEQERSAADASYQSLLKKLEETQLQADDNAALVRVTERAETPKRPVKPSALRVLVAALVLGSLLGVGIALIVDTLQDHVTDVAGVERALGLKILGMVFHVERKERSHLATAAINEKFSQLAEAFAGVRAVLDNEQNRAISRSILVASTMPEEGKTITACNLAISLAQGGQRTVLVDLDLRRPRIGRIFGMPDSHESLLHKLRSADQTTLDQLPFHTECENLDVIGSRAAENLSPNEVLSTQVVRKFLEWALSRYDRVVIDSPPYGLVSDSSVVAGLVGCVIMVFRQNRSRRKLTLHAVRHFEGMGANVLGVVVNDVRRSLRMGSYKQYGTAYR